MVIKKIKLCGIYFLVAVLFGAICGNAFAMPRGRERERKPRAGWFSGELRGSIYTVNICEGGIVTVQSNNDLVKKIVSEYAVGKDISKYRLSFVDVESINSVILSALGYFA